MEAASARPRMRVVVPTRIHGADIPQAKTRTRQRCDGGLVFATVLCGRGEREGTEKELATTEESSPFVAHPNILAVLPTRQTTRLCAAHSTCPKKFLEICTRPTKTQWKTACITHGHENPLAAFPDRMLSDGGAGRRE